MKDILSAIERSWHKLPPATRPQIRAAERSLPFTLPSYYTEFLMWSNGGEGDIGGIYVSLWPIEEVAGLNNDYQIPRYLSQMLAFGTDGGGKCYAFDYRSKKNDPSIVRVPLGDLDARSVESVAADFHSWLQTSIRR